MTQNTDKEKVFTSSHDSEEETVAKSLDKKLDGFANSVEKGIDNLLNSCSKGIEIIDKKINYFDEEKFEKNVEVFFVKMWHALMAFLIDIFPKILNIVLAFFKVAKKKIKNFIDSNSWGTFAPFLFIVVGLIIIVSIASWVRSCLLQ